MFISLIKGDITAAVSSNIAVLLLSPVLLSVEGYRAYKYIRYGEHSYSRIQKILLYFSLAALIIFGIARNIFKYDILIP